MDFPPIGTIGSALGVVGTVSGWVMYALNRWRQTKLTLTVESANGEIFLLNHCDYPIELLQSAATIRDPFTKPDLAQRQTLILGLAGVVYPKERKSLMKIEKSLVDEIEKICAPMAREAQRLLPGAVCPHTVAFELSLRCTRVGHYRVRVAKMTRWISGHPNFGWALTYDPYHHRINRPFFVRLLGGLGEAISALRHPVQAFQHHQQMRNAARMLEVHSILGAIQRKVITSEQGAMRLQKLAARCKVKAEDLIEKYAPELLRTTPANDEEQDSQSVRATGTD